MQEIIQYHRIGNVESQRQIYIQHVIGGITSSKSKSGTLIHQDAVLFKEMYRKCFRTLGQDWDSPSEYGNRWVKPNVLCFLVFQFFI